MIDARDVMLWLPGSLCPRYHEKVMRAGLSTSGRRKCETATVAMGRMATKSVMRQSKGTNGATARMTMPAMKVSEKSIENLNCARLKISEPSVLRICSQ